MPGTGIHLNNMLGEQDLNPLGFHRHPPGRRLPSMMAPTVVLRDGEPELVLGSAGSNRIRSAILQTIVGVVDRGHGRARRRRARAARALRGRRRLRRARDRRRRARGGRAHARPLPRRSTCSSAEPTPRPPTRSPATATRAAAAPRCGVSRRRRRRRRGRSRPWPRRAAAARPATSSWSAHRVDPRRRAALIVVTTTARCAATAASRSEIGDPRLLTARALGTELNGTAAGRHAPAAGRASILAYNVLLPQGTITYRTARRGRPRRCPSSRASCATWPSTSAACRGKWRSSLLVAQTAA